MSYVTAWPPSRCSDKERTNGKRHSRAHCPPLRHLPVEVTYGTQIISSHYVTRLRDEISTAKHRTYYLQIKYKWTDQVWESIAWDSFNHCASRPTLDKTVNRSKIVHNWLNLGSQRARNGRCPDAQLKSRCPYCAATEDFTHLLTCASVRAQKFRYDGMMKLRKVLDGSKGGSAILRAIKNWILQPQAEVTSPADTVSSEASVTRAMESQTAIGWDHIFRGFVSIEWSNFYATADTTSPEARRTNAVSLLSNE